MRSDEFLAGVNNGLGRSLMKSMGYTDDEIRKLNGMQIPGVRSAREAII